MVKHANFTIFPEHDGLKLPGNTIAAYTCVSGYKLENPDNRIVKCEYGLDHSDLSATAVWTVQDKIRCNEGKFHQNYCHLYRGYINIVSVFHDIKPGVVL